MSANLPPCPFCGSNRTGITDTLFSPPGTEDEIQMEFAECWGCHLSMPVGNYKALAARMEKLKREQMQPDLLSQAPTQGDGVYRP